MVMLTFNSSTLKHDSSILSGTAVISASGFATEASTLILRMGTVPNFFLQNLINETILDLKTAGTFQKMDVLVLPVHNASDSRLNWAQAAYDASVAASPSFTPGYGWQLNGTTQYIDTTYNPSLNGVDYTVNSASIMQIYNTNTIKTNYEISGAWDAGQTKRTTLNRPNSYYDNYGLTINCAAANGILTASTERINGIYIGSRTSSTQLDLYVNGSLRITKSDSTVTAAGLPPFTIYIGALNAAGTTSFVENDSVGGYFIGAGLNATECASTNSILQNYRNNARIAALL